MHTRIKKYQNGDMRYEFSHGVNRYILLLNRQQAADRHYVTQAIRRARHEVRR